MQEYYELAAVLIRKKLYVQAIKNLEKSISLWDEEEVELAQVRHAVAMQELELSRCIMQWAIATFVWRRTPWR